MLYRFRFHRLYLAKLRSKDLFFRALLFNGLSLSWEFWCKEIPNQVSFRKTRLEIFNGIKPSQSYPDAWNHHNYSGQSSLLPSDRYSTFCNSARDFYVSHQSAGSGIWLLNLFDIYTGLSDTFKRDISPVIFLGLLTNLECLSKRYNICQTGGANTKFRRPQEPSITLGVFAFWTYQNF